MASPYDLIHEADSTIVAIPMRSDICNGPTGSFILEGFRTVEFLP